MRDALIADGSPFGAEPATRGCPTLQGRVPVGAGAGTGLTARAPGQAGGVESRAVARRRRDARRTRH